MPKMIYYLFDKTYLNKVLLKMKRLLILISGKIGVGKDVSANIIESIYGYENVYMQAMAKSLKGIAINIQQVASLTTNQEENISLRQLEKTKDQPDKQILFGMNTRELLSSLRYIIKSNMGEDVLPVMFLHRWQKSGCQVGIVPDVRFNELDLFQDLVKDTNIKLIHLIIEGPARNRKYINVGLPAVPRCSETITVPNDSTIVELEKKLKHALPSLSQHVHKQQKLGVSIAEFSKLARKADIPSSPKLATFDEVKFITRMVLSELQEIHVSTIDQSIKSAESLRNFMLECLDQVDVPKKLNKDGWTDEEILVEQYDGLADAIYYMYDFAGRHGVNLDLLLDEIHQANMNKKFPDDTFHNREDGKVLKPPGWKEPDIFAILNKQQW